MRPFGLELRSKPAARNSYSNLHRLHAEVRELLRCHFPENNTEGEHVGLLRIWTTAQHLWGHVLESATLPCHWTKGLLHPRETEISHLNVKLVAQHEV